MSTILVQRSPMVGYTNQVIYLEDEDVALLDPNQPLQIFNIKDGKMPSVEKLEMQLEQIEKGGFEHFMLKEIYEQPRAIKDSMRQNQCKKDVVALGGIIEYELKCNAERYIIAAWNFMACGLSRRVPV